MSVENEVLTFSVVIPLYNKVEAVARTIESVLSQSRLPDELVIVDDGSSDGSMELMQELAQKSETTVPFRLIRQENAGVSVARNRGASESEADYICFLDADDEWLPDYLMEVEKLAQAYPQAGVLTIRSSKVNEGREIVPEPSPLPEPYFGVVEKILDAYRRGYGIMHTSAITVKREAWERSEGFPVGAKKSQDMYLWLKLCLSETFAHSSKPLSIWHDDFTGVARRKGVTPYHLNYFLGTQEGKSYLHHDDLMEFLGSNMLAHIGGHRLTKDPEVVTELKRLAKTLPLGHRIKCLLIGVLPMVGLRMLVGVRQRVRGLKR